ncbi:MAG: nucleotidyltransferase domain-containing protein [Sphingomonas sp.]
MNDEALTAAQRRALLQAFAPFASRIERVDLYGSRARGDHRPGSDIDLIITGSLDDSALARLEIALEASDLSVAVDLKRDEDVADAEVRREILRHARLLFRRSDLLAA